MFVFDLPRLALHHVDLRFTEREQEVSFVEMLERKVVSSNLVLNVIVAIGCIVAEIKKAKHSFDISFDDPVTLRTWMVFLGGVLCPSIVSMLCIVRLRSNVFRSLNWEVLVTCNISLTMVGVVFGDGWKIATLYGQDPSHVWDHDTSASECNVALMIDALNTIICLFIPIRMCFKWIAPVFGLIIFSVSGISTGSPFPEHLNTRIFVLLALTCCALWGAWEIEQVARRDFVAQKGLTRKSQQLALQHASNSRILRSLCDALLHLTQDFCIVNPDPRFAALLLCSNPAQIAGSKFIDYLASDEDRQRFTSMLQRGSQTTESQMANTCDGMVQVNCRDTYGRVFALYAYHASIFDADGFFGHTLALVEPQEREAPSKDIAPLECPPNLAVFDDAASKSSDTTTSWSSVGGDGFDEGAAEIAAWVDVSSDDLVIMECSPGFTVFGQFARGSGFCSMMNGTRRRAMKEWLEGTVNAYLADDPIDENPFVLRLRASNDALWECTTKCRIDPGSQIRLEEMVDGDKVYARLLFSQAKWHRRRRTSHVNPLSAMARVSGSANTKIRL